jgi:hypothetical protein
MQSGGKPQTIPAEPEKGPQSAAASQPAPAQETPQPGPAAEESKKKFSKSYGS